LKNVILTHVCFIENYARLLLHCAAKLTHNFKTRVFEPNSFPVTTFRTVKYYRSRFIKVNTTIIRTQQRNQENKKIKKFKFGENKEI
jgi:hypothetical protein